MIDLARLTPDAVVVIFHAWHDPEEEGYAATSERLSTMVADAPGFLGMESLREGEASLTVSYWASEDEVRDWQQQMEHLEAQERGRLEWYRDYQVVVARSMRQYGFERDR